jgi:dTDP-4-dehydrorhamnose 3,5-epimerase
VILTAAPIAGVVTVEIERHRDARGHFARCWCAEAFAAAGIAFLPVQSNLSHTRRRGTLRGLHFQAPPHAEAKLVRCVRGSVFDVVVDLRPESPTHAAWYGVELSRANGRALFIPEGCAHGFQTLSPGTELLYLMGAAYAPAAARGVRWNDPAFAIDWPMPPQRLSARDAAYPDYRP